MANISSAAALLLRAIAIGENVVRIADDLGEDVAADQIATGLGILRLRATLALDLGVPLLPSVNEGLFDDRPSGGRQAQEGAPAVALIGAALDQVAPFKRGDPA